MRNLYAQPPKHTLMAIGKLRKGSPLDKSLVLTIPKDVVKALNLEKGTRLMFFLGHDYAESGQFICQKVRGVLDTALDTANDETD